MTLSEPIDQTHRDSLAVTAWIRDAVDRLRCQIEVWEPRPVPDDYGTAKR
jgi:hypothetical protein